MVIFSLSAGRRRSSRTLVGIVKPSISHLHRWHMEVVKVVRKALDVPCALSTFDSCPHGRLLNLTYGTGEVYKCSCGLQTRWKQIFAPKDTPVPEVSSY